MKVALITPSLNGGGSERVTVNLGNQLKENGHKVIIHTFSKKGPMLQKIDGGIVVQSQDTKTLKSSIFSFRKYLASLNKTDILISNSRISSIVCGVYKRLCLLKVQCIFNEQNTLDEVERLKFFKRKILIYLQQFAYKSADVIVSNSQDTQQNLIDRKIITSTHMTRIINNPIELKTGKNLSHPWFEDTKIKVLVAAGRLTEQKNYPYLVDILTELIKIDKHFRLMILGIGHLEETIKAKIQSQNLERFVEFLHFVDNPEDYFHNSDVFVLTSSWEGFGNVVVEAMATGTQIVVSECKGGPKEIINYGEFGYLGPLGKPKEFSEIILKAIKDDNEETRSRRLNRAKIYSLENITKKYENLIATIK